MGSSDPSLTPKALTETQLSGSPGWLRLLTCFPSRHQFLPQVDVCTQEGRDEPLHLHQWYRGPPCHPRNAPLRASLPRKPLSPFTTGPPVSDSTCLSWNKHECSFRPPVFHTCLPLPPHLPPQSPVIQIGRPGAVSASHRSHSTAQHSSRLNPTSPCSCPWPEKMCRDFLVARTRWGLKPGPWFRLCRKWVSTLGKGTFDKIV